MFIGRFIARMGTPVQMKRWIRLGREEQSTPEHMTGFNYNSPPVFAERKSCERCRNRITSVYCVQMDAVNRVARGRSAERS